MLTATAARDRRLLYVTAFLRATTTRTIGVTSGAYLATLGLDPAALGGVISCGLAGLPSRHCSRRLAPTGSDAGGS